MAIQKPTKFSIGRFTNGACVVIGFVHKGFLHGIIIKTSYPNFYKFISCVKMYEFYEVGEMSYYNFKRIKLFNIIRRIFKEFCGCVNETIDFLAEISDLPSCALRYPFLNTTDTRTVLIEKISIKNRLYNYVNLNSNTELELIKIISKKYGKKMIVNDIYNSNEKKSVKGDMFTKSCTIQPPSFHNGKIFIDLHAYRAMEPIYQNYIDVLHKKQGVKDEFEMLVNKIN